MNLVGHLFGFHDPVIVELAGTVRFFQVVRKCRDEFFGRSVCRQVEMGPEAVEAFRVEGFDPGVDFVGGGLSWIQAYEEKNESQQQGHEDILTLTAKEAE